MTGRYTDGRHAAAHPTWHAEDAPAKARDVDHVVREAGWRPRSVVDLGTGTGDVLHALRDRWDTLGWTDVTYEGWEPSGDALVRGQDGPRVRRHPGHPPPSVRGDLVLCLDVAEHVIDDVALLDSLSAIASHAVIRLPLDLSALDVLRPHRLLSARQDLGHLHAYSRATATARIVEAGWAPVATALARGPHPRHTPRQRAAAFVRAALGAVSPARCADVLGGFSLVVAARRTPR